MKRKVAEENSHRPSSDRWFSFGYAQVIQEIYAGLGGSGERIILRKGNNTPSLPLPGLAPGNWCARTPRAARAGVDRGRIGYTARPPLACPFAS